MSEEFIELQPRKVPVVARPDVLVVGGGCAGIAAACAAARAGANTLLVERNGFLGGTLTAVTLGGFCGGYGLKQDELRPLVAGLYSELIERLFRRDGLLPVRRSGNVHGHPYDPSVLSLVLDELICAYDVDVLFNTSVVDVVRDGPRIETVVISNIDGVGAIRPGMVIDCSGDGDVAFLAGGEVEVGDGSDMQFSSCMFRLSGVDQSSLDNLTREDITAFLERAVDAGYRLPRTAVAIYPGPVPGVFHLNATKVAKPDGSPFRLDMSCERSAAEVEGRRQAFLYEEVARAYLPGFKKARIVDIGSSLGVRETRHVIGDYVLQESDVMGCEKFDDGIVCSAWPVEVHARGTKTIWKHLPDGEYYRVPYRSLCARDFDNLLVAGRNLSATHYAQASARVAATCCGMGEAAGIAAAMALNHAMDIRKIAPAALQDLLVHNGAMLNGHG